MYYSASTDLFELRMFAKLYLKITFFCTTFRKFQTFFELSSARSRRPRADTRKSLPAAYLDLDIFHILVLDL